MAATKKSAAVNNVAAPAAPDLAGILAAMQAQIAALSAGQAAPAAAVKAAPAAKKAQADQANTLQQKARQMAKEGHFVEFEIGEVVEVTIKGEKCLLARGRRGMYAVKVI